jgi:hypothetical protein
MQYKEFSFLDDQLGERIFPMLSCLIPPPPTAPEIDILRAMTNGRGARQKEEVERSITLICSE